jgi:hypothetical protein
MRQLIFRTYRFAILGLSLSTLLDITQPQDLLRALLNAITEYDQAKEEGDNKSSKMVTTALASTMPLKLTSPFQLAYQVQQGKKPQKGRLRACGTLS